MTGLSICEITRRNWPEVRRDIIRLDEKVFPLNLQWSNKSFIRVINDPRHIALILKLNNVIIGDVFGEPIELDKWVKELTADPDFGKGEGEVVELCSIVVDPQYQHQGCGHMLVQEFIRWAKRLGYKKLSGFFREGVSLPLIEKFGAKRIKPYEDWAETGETYWYAKLDLTDK